MCGIMGYAGLPQPAGSIAEKIIRGLEKQEYRGYDSAGLALHCENEVKTIKMVGRVAELAKKARSAISPHETAESGIGHTRWATHGGVTEINAHPHRSADGIVTLLHNGIIENAREIRSDLEKKGIAFVSETDTESAAQLLADIYKNCGGNAFEAMLGLVRSLTGAFALVIMFQDRGREIWCARRGSPLVLAHAGVASYCASDPTALLEYSKDMYFMDEGEIARLRPDGIEFYSFGGKPAEKKAIRLEWDSAMASKGRYEHFMRKEIDEQPDVLRLTIDTHTTATGIAMDRALPLKGMMKNISRVHFVACGTSYYATLVARDIIEALDPSLDIRVEAASEYRYRNIHGGPDTLAVFVSQSGETADTLAAARLARSKGTECIAVTNVRGSTMDREAAHSMHTLAGPEIGVAATKTFTSQIALLAILGLHLLKDRGTLVPADEARLIDGMRRLPSKLQEQLAQEDRIKEIAIKYSGSSGYFFIGRRESVPLAMEGALKLKEIAYSPAEAYAAGEMKHGPIAMLDENLTVVALAPDTDIKGKTISNVEECRARNAPIIMLVTEGDEEAAAYANDAIPIPRTEKELIPFVGLIPLQLFAYHTARTLGRDIDMPRNLAKSVTVE